MSQTQGSSLDTHKSDIAESSSVPEEITPSQRSVSLWRNRDYLLLWSGQLISNIGTQVSQLAFPLLLLAVTRSPVQAGIVGALRSLPSALLCLPAGAMIDRWNRKKVMVFCDTVRALVLGSIPLALWLGHLTIYQLYVVSLIEGTLFTFFSLAEATSLPHIGRKEQLSTTTAQNQATDSASFLLGPLLGGMLYGLGRAVPFLLDAISYICSVLGLLFMRAKLQEERNEVPKKMWSEVGEGINWLWHDSVLRFLALLTCGLMTPVAGYALILVTLAQSFHTSSFVIGTILAGSGIGSIIGSLLANLVQKHFPFGQVITWSA